MNQNRETRRRWNRDKKKTRVKWNRGLLSCRNPSPSRVKLRSFEKRNREILIQNRSRPNPTCSKNAAGTSDSSPEKRLAEPHRRDYGIITPKLGSEAKKIQILVISLLKSV
ncbi:unnamed protein product [Brassica rapa subsp. trilocularis]